MAVLSSAERDSVRNFCTNHASFVGHGMTKAQLNAAVQALEDWLEAERSQLSALLNTATSPVVLTNAQKKAVFAGYLALKYAKEK